MIHNYNRLNDIKVFLIPLFCSLLISCSENSINEKTVNLTLAAEMSLLPTTVWVAESKGFFKKHNVNLTIKEFDSGRNALESMLNDSSINIATVAQTPVVFNSFKNEPYVIVATMAYSLDDIKVLARKDHGIESAEDLKGKNIGATKRSTGHYFLESYLSHYDLGLSDTNLIDINASKLKDALISGKVDAITSWEPHIHNAEQELGKDNLSLLLSPTPFRKDFYFTTGRKFAVEHKDSIKQFLAALVEAEEFIALNPQESMQIVSKRLNTEMDMIGRIWSSFTFKITLEQSILVNLENEAVWAMGLSNNNEELPNYLDFIDTNPLVEVKPHGVNLIH